MIVTSPPYLNAIDYLRCSKFSLVWIGYSIPELRRIRAESVGAEVSLRMADSDVVIQEVLGALRLKPKLPSRQYAILTRYAHDMRKSLAEAARVLVPGGKALYVVGENTVRGTFIPNAKMIAALGKSVGFELVTVTARNLPANKRYMPPPKSDMGGAGLGVRMRREVVLSMRKLATRRMDVLSRR